MPLPRREPAPRCLSCNYDLSGLERGECPECGRRFDLGVPGTYIVGRAYRFWRFWLPGFLLAAAAGTIVTAVSVSRGVLNAGVWIGVPLALGCMLGYAGRFRALAAILIAITVAGSVAIGMMSLSLAGVFCGLTLAGVFFGPLLLGVALGALLRHILKSSPYSQRAYLRSLVFLLIPIVWILVEGAGPDPDHVAVVVTKRSIAAAPADVWDALMFYEEVDAEPPLLLRLGLPRPVRAEGSMRRAGDVKVCIYEHGELHKRITRVEPHHRIDFEVTHQQIGFERSVSLRSGAFTLTPAANGRTHMALSTGYTPHLAPRFVWGPIERLAVRTLHNHVVDGVERAVMKERRNRIALWSPNP